MNIKRQMFSRSGICLRQTNVNPFDPLRSEASKLRSSTPRLRLEEVDAERSRSIKCQIGQSLIEVLLALGVAVVIVTAITSVVVSALNNASFSNNQNLANSYAQEGMEVLRGIRDQSWTTFSALGVPPPKCLSKGSQQPTARAGTTCAGAGEGEILVGGNLLIREINVNNNHIDCRPSGPSINNHKVRLAVSWSDGKCPTCAISPDCPTGRTFCHEVRLVSCLGQKSSNVVPP